MTYDDENGKAVLTKGFLLSPACLLSSEHFALASTCTNAGPTFLQCLSFLCSVLCLILILPLRLSEH